jgi:hypothetical protein
MISSRERKARQRLANREKRRLEKEKQNAKSVELTQENENNSTRSSSSTNPVERWKATRKQNNSLNATPTRCVTFQDEIGEQQATTPPQVTTVLNLRNNTISLHDGCCDSSDSGPSSCRGRKQQTSSNNSQSVTSSSRQPSDSMLDSASSTEFDSNISTDEKQAVYYVSKMQSSNTSEKDNGFMSSESSTADRSMLGSSDWSYGVSAALMTNERTKENFVVRVQDNEKRVVKGSCRKSSQPSKKPSTRTGVRRC